MNMTDAGETGRKISARRDIVLIILIAVLTAFVCVKLNLSEALLSWKRPRERLQLDEVPAVLLVIAISLIWFSSRRYFDATRQLRLRRRVEARLARAMIANIDRVYGVVTGLIRQLRPVGFDDLGVGAALEPPVSR